jgi:tape measure domain-containing protein
MALDIGTLVAKLRVDDGDFEQKSKGWSTISGTIASAFGNVAANAISSASSYLMDFAAEAAEASDATDKFRTSLQFQGLDTATIDRLTDSTRTYADETVYALTDVMNITSNLAGAGMKDYDQLAEKLGNFNAAAGGSAETYGRLGLVMTQTAGAGKLTTENWNQITDAIGGSSVQIQNALLEAGAYTGDFRKAMESGEITAEEFNAAIMQLGSDPIAVEAAKSVDTFEGALGNLEASIMGVLMDGLNAVKPYITGFIKVMADFISNTKLSIPVISALGVVLLAALAPSIWGAVTATWAFTTALLANPITWIVLAVAALVAGIVALAMNWDTVVAWITEVWGGFIGWITEVIDGFVTWWNGIWEAVGQFFTDVWNNLVQWVTDLVLGWITWQVEILTGFLDWWNGLWASVGQFFTDVWNGFVQWVTDLVLGWVMWQMSLLTGFLDWWNGLWASVGQFFTDVWNGFISWVQGLVQGYVSWMFGIFAGFLSWWNGLWSSVGSFFTDLWNNLVNWVQSIPQAIINVFAGAGQWLFDAGKNIIQGLWNGLKNIWNSVSAWFQDTIGGMVDTVKDIFGIASPSKVFFGFGLDIGRGLINGLAAMEPAVSDGFESMVALPDIPVQSSPRSDGPRDESGGSREFHYHAAPNASFDAKEELFAALGSPRVGDL